MELLIVGDGPEKKNLKELSKLLRIDKHINFIGPVPNRNIGEIFSRCLVSVSASESEAFGIVNIESLREGTPVICTNTEGAKDIIVNGKNGFIVDLTKKNDLSKTISKIIKNWDFFSVNALNTFNEKYSKENIAVHAEKIINIMRNINN
jgi:glycosyltransferase involved in cell wall biosynthesis